MNNKSYVIAYNLLMNDISYVKTYKSYTRQYMTAIATIVLNFNTITSSVKVDRDVIDNR